MQIQLDDRIILENWEKIFHIVNDGLMLVRPDGSIFRANHALEALLGYSRNELNGKHCAIINCDACDRLATHKGEPCCKLFQDGEDIKKKCLVNKKDGSYLPVLKNATILQNDQGRLIGAVETFTDISEIQQLDRKVTLLSRHVYGENGFQGIIGQSEEMKHIFDIISKAARSEAPVLITGKSGTGKELVAQAIHNLSRRKEGPLVRVNCAALNAALLESELFGHIKGAFTGAYRHRMGRFEYANGGHLFLDEIGDLPLSVQVKLLRVLEAKQIERVGDQRPIPVDVRILSATNRNLSELIASKKFREDLFFRINVIPIDLPPLRNRMEDVPLLLKTFIYRQQTLTGKDIKGLSKEAMDTVMAYRWPGNVRELKSALEYAFVLKEEGLIEVEDLPKNLQERNKPALLIDAGLSRNEQTEKQALIHALKQALGNKSKAAQLLGVSRGTVWNRMRKYRIEIKDILLS